MEFTPILKRFFTNYVLRFFLITTLANLLLWFVIFPIIGILETHLYPDGTQSLIPDTIVFLLPVIFMCVGLFLRLRHPNAKVERADAIMYAIIFAVLLIAGGIAAIASGGQFGALAPTIILWTTSFPYAPSIIIWAYAFGSEVGNIIMTYILSTLAFAAVTSWIFATRKEKRNTEILEA